MRKKIKNPAGFFTDNPHRPGLKCQCLPQWDKDQRNGSIFFFGKILQAGTDIKVEITESSWRNYPVGETILLPRHQVLAETDHTEQQLTLF